MNAVTTDTSVIKNQERYHTDRLGLLTLLLLSLLIQAVFFIIVIYVLRGGSNPPPVVFPATAEGQLLAEPPLDKPNLANNEVLNWITEAISTSFTFNFANYQTVTKKVQKYFTTDGYENYQKALVDNKITELVLTQKLVLQAIPRDAPQVTKQGELAGRFLWKIKFPMQFRYQSMTVNNAVAADIIVLIMRVPSLESPNGISILKIDMEIRPLI